MGVAERLIVSVIALGVIGVSFMIFMLGLFFLQNRKRAEEFFLKSFSEQMNSLAFFKEIPIFGPMYYSVGVWYVNTFPKTADNHEADAWHTQAEDHPVWLNKNTASYFVVVVAAILVAYSIITAVVSVGGIYIMVEPIPAILSGGLQAVQ